MWHAFGIFAVCAAIGCAAGWFLNGALGAFFGAMVRWHSGVVNSENRSGTIKKGLHYGT